MKKNDKFQARVHKGSKVVFKKGLRHKMAGETFRDIFGFTICKKKRNHFSGRFFNGIKMAKPDFSKNFPGPPKGSLT